MGKLTQSPGLNQKAKVYEYPKPESEGGAGTLGQRTLRYIQDSQKRLKKRATLKYALAYGMFWLLLGLTLLVVCLVATTADVNDLNIGAVYEMEEPTKVFDRKG